MAPAAEPKWTLQQRLDALGLNYPSIDVLRNQSLIGCKTTLAVWLVNTLRKDGKTLYMIMAAPIHHRLCVKRGGEMTRTELLDCISVVWSDLEDEEKAYHKKMTARIHTSGIDAALDLFDMDFADTLPLRSGRQTAPPAAPRTAAVHSTPLTQSRVYNQKSTQTRKKWTLQQRLDALDIQYHDITWLRRLSNIECEDVLLAWINKTFDKSGQIMFMIYTVPGCEKIFASKKGRLADHVANMWSDAEAVEKVFYRQYTTTSKDEGIQYLLDLMDIDFSDEFPIRRLLQDASSQTPSTPAQKSPSAQHEVAEQNHVKALGKWTLERRLAALNVAITDLDGLVRVPKRTRDAILSNWCRNTIGLNGKMLYLIAKVPKYGSWGRIKDGVSLAWDQVGQAEAAEYAKSSARIRTGGINVLLDDLDISISSALPRGGSKKTAPNPRASAIPLGSPTVANTPETAASHAGEPMQASRDWNLARRLHALRLPMLDRGSLEKMEPLKQRIKIVAWGSGISLDGKALYAIVKIPEIFPRLTAQEKTDIRASRVAGSQWNSLSVEEKEYFVHMTAEVRSGNLAALFEVLEKHGGGPAPPVPRPTTYLQAVPPASASPPVGPPVAPPMHGFEEMSLPDRLSVVGIPPYDLEKLFELQYEECDAYIGAWSRAHFKQEGRTLLALRSAPKYQQLVLSQGRQISKNEWINEEWAKLGENERRPYKTATSKLHNGGLAEFLNILELVLGPLPAVDVNDEQLSDLEPKTKQDPASELKIQAPSLVTQKENVPQRAATQKEDEERELAAGEKPESRPAGATSSKQDNDGEVAKMYVVLDRLVAREHRSKSAKKAVEQIVEALTDLLFPLNKTYTIVGRTIDGLRVDYNPQSKDQQTCIATRIQQSLANTKRYSDVDTLLRPLAEWNKDALFPTLKEVKLIETECAGGEVAYADCWAFHGKAYHAITPVKFEDVWKVADAVVLSLRARARQLGVTLSAAAVKKAHFELVECFKGAECESTEYEDRIEACLYRFELTHVTTAPASEGCA